MKRTCLMGSLVAALALLMTHATQAAELPDLIDRIQPGVVGVGTSYPPRQPNVRGDRATYLGTGFVVGDGRHIITNAHVIAVELDADNRQTLAVFSGRGAEVVAHPARELARDSAHDLAILEIDGAGLPALSLGDSDLIRAGQEIAFTGFPLGMALGLYPVTHRGIVSAITPTAQPVSQANQLNTLQISRMRSGFDAFQLDATAYPGNSGSPVFELKHGLVIGVVNSVVVKETRESMLATPSGITYALPAKYIKPLLDAATRRSPLDPVSQ
ncbi:MAG: serine protease [Halioglobus sp.]